jgi:hypothetical protein
MFRFEGLGWGLGLSLTQALPIIPMFNFEILFIMQWALVISLSQTNFQISETHKIQLYTCYFFALAHLICCNGRDWAMGHGVKWGVI